MLSSGYFRLSVILAAGLWRQYRTGEWADYAISIIPTVLGLTLAGAAILTTIGGDAFRERLALLKGSKGQEAPILELLSNFIVAMLVQIIALVAAILFKAKPFDADWLHMLGLRSEMAEWINVAAGGIGSLLLIYGILLILGAAFTVRALASVYVRDVRRESGET
jgi:hypothetical protein